MKEFIISYIEDNEIVGHKKEILVVGLLRHSGG